MTGIIASIVLIVGLVGVTLALTPYLMPPTECFTVTVPPSAKGDPRIKALFRTHTIIVAALAVVGSLLIALMLPSANDLAASIVMMAGTLLPIIGSFAFMLSARKQVMGLKRAEGWTSSQAHAAAFVSDDSIPEPIPIAWELLHVLVVLALAAFALLAYDRLPDQIPMHAGLDGTVNGYASKSLGTVMFPVLLAAFLGITMALAHWGILRSKRPVDPAAPATSALAYGQFARAQSIIMLVGGLAMSACIGASFFLSSMGTITLGTAGIITTVVAIAFVAAEIWVSVRHGQSGARMAAELRTSDEVARDDDAFWKLGTFYCNGDDPSVFVPKRFGMGWTINIARPAAWALFALIILLAVAFSVISIKLVG